MIGKDRLILTFGHPTTSPEIVTNELNLQPTSMLAAGASFESPKGIIRSTHSSSWEFHICECDPGDLEFSLSDFLIPLEQKRDAILRLLDLDFWGYLTVKLVSDNLFFDMKSIEIISKSGLGLSIEFLHHVEIEEDTESERRHEYSIPVPANFYSQLDEDAFFSWLKAIPAIKNVAGVNRELILSTRQNGLDESSRKELEYLMTRYSLDPEQLICIAT